MSTLPYWNLLDWFSMHSCTDMPVRLHLEPHPAMLHLHRIPMRPKRAVERSEMRVQTRILLHQQPMPAMSLRNCLRWQTVHIGFDFQSLQWALSVFQWTCLCMCAWVLATWQWVCHLSQWVSVEWSLLRGQVWAYQGRCCQLECGHCSCYYQMILLYLFHFI